MEDEDSDIEFLVEINSEEGLDEKEERRLVERCLKRSCFVKMIKCKVKKEEK